MYKLTVNDSGAMALTYVNISDQRELIIKEKEPCTISSTNIIMLLENNETIEERVVITDYIGVAIA